MKGASKTAWFAAVQRWDAVGAAIILAASRDLLAARDAKGRQAIHLACAVKPGGARLVEEAGLLTVTMLLEAGAGLESAVPMPEDEGDFRATPLWYAAARGENLALVHYLLRRGADASPPLWAAVWRDDAVLLGALLEAKPRLDLRAHGETPLFYAARLKRLKTLDLLIAAGADPAIPDDHGRKAIEIARARRLPKTFIERLAAAKR